MFSRLAQSCAQQQLARWLHEHGIASLAACTQSEWRDYAAWRVKDGVNRDHARKTLGQLTDQWAFDQLTEPLDPQVAGPLLVWAIRLSKTFPLTSSQPGTRTAA